MENLTKEEYKRFAKQYYDDHTSALRIIAKQKKYIEMLELRLFYSENVPSESDFDNIGSIQLGEDRDAINRLKRDNEFNEELNIVRRK